MARVYTEHNNRGLLLMESIRLIDGWRVSGVMIEPAVSGGEGVA